MRMDIQTTSVFAAVNSALAAATKAKTLSKKEVADDIDKAASSPRAQLSDRARGFVNQKIEAIQKRLLILKKLFANDPKQMARALAQVFKELKAALKEYKAAGDQELGASADIVQQALTPSLTSDSAPSSTPEQPTDTAPRNDQTPARSADDPHAAYAEVESGFRKIVGEDGMSFARDLTSLVNEIEEKIFSVARIQMKAKKPEKDMDEAFKDAEDSLKDLRKSIEDMQSDIRREVPDVGMRLSVAA